MVTMVTVARSGGRYDEAWVERLHRGAREHVGGLARFVCLTDLPLDLPGVAAVPLDHDWPRWWAKFEAFRPGLTNDRTILCDLDTVFSGDATALGEGPGTLAMEDFFHRGRVSTAIMAFDAGTLGILYDRFAADPARWMAPGSCGNVPNAVHGDQVVVDHLLRDAGEPFGFIQSERPGLLDFYNPDRTPRGPVTIFIGDAKPDTAPEPMASLWRGARLAEAA